MHDHDRGGQRPTDRRIDTSDEQDHNQDQAWFECACCGTRYRSRRTAMQCCAECFDDPDHDPRSPPVAMTDGGHSAAGTERTSEPVVVEWTGGMDNNWTVEVDPYSGSVTVNGREFDIGVLVSDDIPDWMYRSMPAGTDQEAER
jgi:hypothetical protein